MRGKVVSYFLDDRTRVYWVYLLKEKFETTNVFQTFHRMIQNQFQAKLLVFRTNNGGDILLLPWVIGLFIKHPMLIPLNKME